MLACVKLSRLYGNRIRRDEPKKQEAVTVREKKNRGGQKESEVLLLNSWYVKKNHFLKPDVPVKRLHFKASVIILLS